MSIVTRKLLVEEPSFDLQYLVEEKNKNEPSILYIQGPFLMSEQKNKNGRIYNLSEMVQEVGRYTSEMIKENRSLGELNHPESVEVNPERACHMITELRQEGNMFFGKSKILSTPMGSLVRALIMDNVKLGISSRALGKLLPQGESHAVQGFHLICCDIVHDPSVASAFVNGIMEAKNWILEQDGKITEAYDIFENKINNQPKKASHKEAALNEAVLKFIASLKNSTK
ncbi:MAG: primosomal protein [Patescibacteria group bacterium]|jgi:hypothetical protein